MSRLRALVPLFALFLALCLALACGGGSSAEPRVDAGHPVTDAGHDALHDAGRPDVRSDVATLPDVFVPARAAGDRTPLSADCEDIDGTRCLLPWPSNTYTVVDKTTPTGLRLHLSSQGIGMTDDATSANRADGFSRVTPILTGFAGTVDPTSLGDLTTGAVKVIVEQPGPTFGQLVPLRFDVQNNGDTTNPQSVIVAYTRVPLAPATDYAVVVTDDATLMGGQALAPNRDALVALGLAAPTTTAEGQLYAYDAPVRQAMTAAGLDSKHAVRIWDFTTRSLNDPSADLLSMRAAEIAAFDAATTVGIAIDSAMAGTGTVEYIVLGRITAVPSYLTSSGSLNRSATGAVTPIGVHDVPFRAALPTGTGNYDIVMYGHGTGGDYDEPDFDQQITAAGACKIGTPFIGWTSETVIATFGGFQKLLVGTDISTSGLTQSLADAMVVQHALTTTLGDALSGMTIAGGESNPMFGRRPNVSNPVFAGGSLGGTMGFVYSSVEPSIVAAVLNVPGAAWTHLVPYSILFNYVRPLLLANYPTDIDIFLGIATTQIDWDPVDGAAWYDAVGDHFPVLLEQESIGDPVLPNIGDEMVAAASHADQVGIVLNPIVTCPDVSSAAAHNGITQFEVPSSVTDPYDIHGFAANDTPAGIAAQQQIVSFIESVWARAPVISVPPECATNTPAMSCDFSNFTGQ